MSYLNSSTKLLLVLAFMAFSLSASAQEPNKQLFDETIDYINCRLAQLSLTEQNNGQAPHIEAFRSRFDCNQSMNNGDLLNFLRQKNLSRNITLNNAVNSFKSKFSPTLTKAQVISLLEDDLIEVRLETFAANRPESFGELRTDLSAYINNVFKDFDGELIADEIEETEPEPESIEEPVVENEDQPEEIAELPANTLEDTSNKNIGFLIWMLIGALLGALIYNAFLRWFKKSPPPAPDADDIRAFRNKNNALQNELENLRLQNSTLINEITGLKKEIFKLESRLNPVEPLLTKLEEEE
ncbi:MAG: hypothetical protein AAF502_20035 [Bacteroidota bacterium]